MLSQPLRFIPHQPPLADFLIVVGADTRTRAVMSELGARVVPRVGHDVYLWGFPVGDILLSGLGILDGKLVDGPRALRAVPAKLGTGSYAIVDLGQPITRVKTDPNGGHVLYSAPGLLTNRLHLAAIATKRINYAAGLSSVHSNHMFCQQFGTLATPVLGVDIARPGDTFSISERVDTESVSFPTGYFDVLKPEDYRTLIQAGAQELVETVEAIIDGPYSVLCDLTGGQDSRLVFAALVAAGRVGDVAFRTHFSKQGAALTATVDLNEALRRKRADVTIAAGLLKRFGGVYANPDKPAQKSSTTIEGNLSVRRSQRFGSYHFINSAVLTETIFLPDPFVRMNGGGGELYRDYYQRFFQAVDPEAAYSESDVRRMIKATFNPRMPSTVLDSILGSFE